MTILTTDLTALAVTGGCSLLLILMTYFIGNALYNIFFHPLASIPGPMINAISQMPMLWESYHGRLPFAVKKLHDTYGPVVRTSPRDVSFIDASIWKDVYGFRPRDGNGFVSDPSFRRGKKGSGIGNADATEHSRHRHMISHAFSEKALRGQEEIMQQYVNLLITDLKLHLKRPFSEPVDMTKRYNWTTFDIIGDLAFGQSFDCLKTGKPHYVISMVNDLFSSLVRSQPCRRIPLLSIFEHYLVPMERLESIKKFETFALETMKRRIEDGNPDRNDFMSYILAHNDRKEFTDAELTGNAAALLVAGSETSATTLSAATFYLLKNPSVYQRLVKEIRSKFEKEEDIVMSELDNLPYLSAVFAESMRIFPPVPSAMARLVPAGGKTICGRFIPENTIVSISQYSAYLSESNFSCPRDFIPERWLEDQRFKNDVTEVYQPFSVGPRNCIGQNMAKVEMRLILCKVLWNFDLELSPASANWIDDQLVYALWKKGPLMVNVKNVARG